MILYIIVFIHYIFLCIIFSFHIIIIVFVTEFITASPVLYKLLALFEDWETHFTNQLQAHPSGPPILFQPGEREQAGYGPALTRHKFILEPEHSPFR